MKKSIKIIIIFLIVTNSVKAQFVLEPQASHVPKPYVPDSTKLEEQPSEAEKTAVKTNEELLIRIEELLKEKENMSVTIGELSTYNLREVPILDNENTFPKDTASIYRIDVTFKYGYISFIRATAMYIVRGDTVPVTFLYSNPTSIINSNTINWNNRFLKPENPNFKDYKIRLSDLLNYSAFKNRYYPADGEHTFLKDSIETHVYKVKRSYHIGSVIEGKIYTDFNGLDGQSFGLVQTELKMTVNLSTKNCKKIIFFNHGQVKFSTSKFDSKFDTLMLPDYNRTINSTEVLTRSYRQLNFDLSLIHYQNIVHFDLMAGYQLNSTRLTALTDTVGGFDVNQHSINFEPRWELPVIGEHLTLELSPRVLWIVGVNNGPKFKNDKALVFNPEVLLSYYPDEDKGSGVYFRWALFDNLNVDEKDVMFWQLGYKVNFNEVFSGLIKKGEK
jgi:hypothetical protein